jgi:hypothetical protein
MMAVAATTTERRVPRKMKGLLLQLRSRLARALFPLRVARPDEASNSVVPGPVTEEVEIGGASAASAPAQTSDGQTSLLGDALALSEQLAGQPFLVPNLRQAFAYWPLAANENLARLERLVDETLERVIKSPRKLAALKQADFALLIALYVPEKPECLLRSTNTGTAAGTPTPNGRSSSLPRTTRFGYSSGMTKSTPAILPYQHTRSWPMRIQKTLASLCLAS